MKLTFVKIAYFIISWGYFQFVMAGVDFAVVFVIFSKSWAPPAELFVNPFTYFFLFIAQIYDIPFGDTRPVPTYYTELQFSANIDTYLLDFILSI